MGTLSTVGVISSGKLSNSSAELYKTSVSNTVKNGLSIGSTDIPAGVISLGLFETGSISDIKATYPAWNSYYVDGILSNLVGSLDKIPDTGVGFPIVFDPTKPVAIILTELSEIFQPLTSILSIPLQDIILSNLSVFLEKSGEITEKLKSIVDALSGTQDEIVAAAENFLETIKETISESLTSAGKRTDEVISTIEENKDNIVQKIIQIAESLKDAALSIVPDLPIPSLDLSFISPEISVAPLFATIEANGQDGIATKFIKLLTVFLKIPSEVFEAIKTAIQEGVETASRFVADLYSAIGKLFTDITQAVKDMLSALLGFVWDRITAVLDINPAAILELSSTASAVVFFVKSLIVSLIGFVLGSGLITLSVAKLLEIV
jgi:hypothetical protein